MQYASSVCLILLYCFALYAQSIWQHWKRHTSNYMQHVYICRSGCNLRSTWKKNNKFCIDLVLCVIRQRNFNNIAFSTNFIRATALESEYELKSSLTQTNSIVREQCWWKAEIIYENNLFVVGNRRSIFVVVSIVFYVFSIDVTAPV